LDALIEKLPKRSGAICNGMAHRGRLNVFNIFGKSTQDILVNLTVKIMTKNILTEM
jgi:2-oxoglutarate dehydrogenase complex dehydrogenase (E1) component-like enzyme